MTVSHVAASMASMLIRFLHGDRQYQNGSLTAVSAGEEVVPASELTAAIKQIKELQRLLGQHTMEVALLKRSGGVRSRKKNG